MENKDALQLTIRHRNCLLNECCFWFYHVLVVALPCVIIAKISLASILKNQVIESPQLMHSKQTVELWKKGYIIDIKSVNTNNCPQGYTPLLEYTWTGTSEGCFCSATVSNYTVEYILNGKCTSQLINEGCKQILPLQEQKLHMWKGGKLICQKRASSINFYDSILIQTNEGVVMKKCSQDKKYQMNVLPNVNCPITQISNTTLSASATLLQLDLVNNKKLSYVQQNNFPIADFKVSQYSFCQFLDQINISPNKIGNYKLQITKYNACTGQDARYMQFDKMNQEQFFTNNTSNFKIIKGVYDKLQQLQGYPRPSTNYVFKLGYIRYPEWTYNCRVSSSHSLGVATDRLLFLEQQRVIEVMLSVSMPCLVVFAFLFRVFFLLRHIVGLKTKMTYNAVFLSDDQIIEQLPNLNIHRNKSTEISIFIFEQLLRIAVFLVVILALLKMLQTSVWTKQVFKYSCTQKYVNNIFRFYQEKTDKIVQVLVQVCFIWCVLQIIDIVYFILRWKYLDLVRRTQMIEDAAESSEQTNPINDKQLNGGEKDQFMGEQSSEVILQRDKQLKIKDIDDFMGDQAIFGAGQTKGNFYDIQNNDFNLISTKRKKKKAVKKIRNLFKQQK